MTNFNFFSRSEGQNLSWGVSYLMPSCLLLDLSEHYIVEYGAAYLHNSHNRQRPAETMHCVIGNLRTCTLAHMHPHYGLHNPRCHTALHNLQFPIRAGQQSTCSCTIMPRILPGLDLWIRAGSPRG